MQHKDSIIDRLRQIPGSTFLGYCIHNWIDQGYEEEELIYQIQSISKETPDTVEMVLGADLFTDIQNYVLC